MTTRYNLSDFNDFATPKADDRPFAAFMEIARAELVERNYWYCNATGTEYESGRWISRYSNPAEFHPQPSRAAIWHDVFTRAIRSRAARLANVARA